MIRKVGEGGCGECCHFRPDTKVGGAAPLIKPHTPIAESGTETRVGVRQR